jgi:hypothetical protein
MSEKIQSELMPTCLLCKIGEHGWEYRVFTLSHGRMVREMRNKPQPEKKIQVLG